MAGSPALRPPVSCRGKRKKTGGVNQLENSPAADQQKGRNEENRVGGRPAVSACRGRGEKRGRGGKGGREMSERVLLLTRSNILSKKETGATRRAATHVTKKRKGGSKKKLVVFLRLSS